MGVPSPLRRETNFISKLLTETEREKINNNQNCFVAIRFVRRAHTHNNNSIILYVFMHVAVAAVQCDAIGVSAIDIHLHICRMYLI